MKIEEIYQDRTSFHLPVGSPIRIAGYVMMALGLGVGVWGLSQGLGKEFWGAYLFNLFFFFSLGLGGIVFCTMQDVIGAHWARPIRRIHEAFGAFVPVAALLFLVFIAAVGANLGDAQEVYRWISSPKEIQLYYFWGKDSWLKPGFFVVRTALMVVAIGSLAFWQLRLSLKRDLNFIGTNKGVPASEEYLIADKMKFWGGGVLVAYGILFTFLGMDLVMSLSPLWFSTLWGGWQFAIMMQTLMASTLVVMFALKSTKIGKVYKRQQFHDVGKLMHGFSVFFAYLTYAHVLTYWYGNIPEFTEYFIHRLHEPWIYIVCIAPFFNFLIPLYLLIFKAAKWTPWVAIPISLMILVAQWFVNLLVVMPEVVDVKNWVAPMVLEGGMLLLFFGLFVTVFQFFGKKFPMVAVADPLLKDALEDHH